MGIFVDAKDRLVASVQDYTPLERLFLVCFGLIFIGYFCFSASMQRNFIYLPAPFLIFYLYQNRKCGVFQATFWMWPALALYLGYNYASVFWSPGFYAGMAQTYLRYEMMAVLFTCGLAVLIQQHTQSWAYFYKAYIYAAVLSGIVLLIWYGVIIVHGHFYVPRLKGFGRGGNSNMCAALYSVAILFLFYARDEAGHLTGTARFRLAAFLLMIAVIVPTMGRGPLLALFCTLLGMALLQQQYKRFGLILLAYAVIGGFVLWNPADWGDIMKRGDDNRFQIWREALRYPEAKPVFGTGAGAELDFTVPGMTEHFNSTHDLFLGALVYGGVIGLAALLLAYGTMIFYGVRYSWRAQDKSVLALIFYGTIFFLFETHTLILNANPEWLFFYVPMAVSAGFLARPIRAGSPEILASA